MPPKKVSPKKDSPGKGKKESPKDKKGSPPKGKGSPGKGKEKFDVTSDVEESVKPPTPPPKFPPLAAENHSHLLRQHWYVEADKPNAKIQENWLNPYYALVTSWGDVWVSDPPRRRIAKYSLDPRNGEIYKLGDIVLRGEPYHMAEKPHTGRVYVLMKSPSIPKVSILELAPETAEIENKIIFPFTPPTPDMELERPLVDVDESEPIGMALNDGLLFVVRSPIQKMCVFNTERFTQVLDRDLFFQCMDKYWPACERISPSGGCAYSNRKLYVACDREPGILVFDVLIDMCYSVIDRIIVRCVSRFQEPRLMQPFGVCADPLNSLIVTDCRWDYVHIFNRKTGLDTSSLGGWKLKGMRPHRPGHVHVSKNGIMAIVCHRHNEVLLFFDETIFNWYHGSLFYLDHVHCARTVVDRMAVPVPDHMKNRASYVEIPSPTLGSPPPLPPNSPPCICPTCLQSLPSGVTVSRGMTPVHPSGAATPVSPKSPGKAASPKATGKAASSKSASARASPK